MIPSRLNPMRSCPRCNASFPDDARFCPEDGTQLVVPGDGDDPHIGKILLGQFEVREICGRGSMGTVYRAWQDSMERDVAVKILRRDLLRDDKVVKRFHREARAAAKLNHPNIITVYLVGDTDDGLPFIVMEHVTGESLDQACTDSNGPMPVVRAIHIAKQIAAALTEAHAHNVVHRDLKPENILLSAKKNSPDFVKVLDFGIAKILYANDEPLTQTGAIFGTPHYLAPEQASGSDIDHRCDLYALGVILFRMVTGRLPFDSPSGMEVLIQHLREQPPRPRDLVPSVPHSLEEVILRCLAKAPEDRVQSGEDLSEALNQVVEGLRHTTSFGVGHVPTAPAEDGVRPYPPTQVGVPAAQAPPTADLPSDPRYKVPSDGELAAAVAPTMDDLSRPRDDVTEPVVHAGATRDVGSTTVGLARDIKGRRPFLLHGLLALGSILVGGAAGALVYRSGQQGAGEIEPPLEPEPGPIPVPDPALSPPDQGTAALAPDAGAPHRTARTVKKRIGASTTSPRRPKKPKKTATKPRQPAVKRKSAVVKAPAPLGRVTDHHAAEEPEPRPAPKPLPAPKEPEVKPEPAPEPKARKDDFYDLVD